MDFYEASICGLTRKLPIVAISKNTKLASFNFLGDVELVDKLADTFTEKLKSFEFDYLVTPHVKITPLIHGIAKRLGQSRYVVCRKAVKSYMNAPVVMRPSADVPKHVKTIVLNGNDKLLISGKRVVVIDDVISTGSTMTLMHQLLTQISCKIVVTCAVFTQGALSQDIFTPHIILGELPIFKTVI